jgi:hypothetical protein
MRISKLAAAMLLGLLVAGFAVAQKEDLSGTWVGDTTVPITPEKVQLTLVLKQSGDTSSGTVTDSMGMANQSAMENVKFASGILTFEFNVSVEGQYIRVSTQLKLSEGKLTGSWQSEDGSSGNIELVRK